MAEILMKNREAILDREKPTEDIKKTHIWGKDHSFNNVKLPENTEHENTRDGTCVLLLKRSSDSKDLRKHKFCQTHKLPGTQ